MDGGQYLQIDLGMNYTVVKIVIQWGSSQASFEAPEKYMPAGLEIESGLIGGESLDDEGDPVPATPTYTTIGTWDTPDRPNSASVASHGNDTTVWVGILVRGNGKTESKPLRLVRLIPRTLHAAPFYVLQPRAPAAPPAPAPAFPPPSSLLPAPPPPSLPPPLPMVD